VQQLGNNFICCHSRPFCHWREKRLQQVQHPSIEGVACCMPAKRPRIVALKKKNFHAGRGDKTAVKNRNFEGMLDG
jgi:hypothetical protein